MQPLPQISNNLWNDLHPPFQTLPSRYLPSEDPEDHEPLPTLSFGIALTTSQALDIVKKYSIYVPQPEQDNYGVLHVYQAVQYIAQRAGLLRVQPVIPLANDYEWILQLFTNHTYCEYPLSDAKIMKRVRRAAEMLGNGQQPLWWWSTEGGQGPNAEESWPTSWLDANHVAPEFRAQIPQELCDEWHKRQRRREKEDKRLKAAEAKKREEKEDEVQMRTCLDEDIGDESDGDACDEDEISEESDGNETERPRR